MTASTRLAPGRPPTTAVLRAVGLALAVACSPQSAPEAQSDEETAVGDDSTPAARIGDEEISIGDVDDWIKEDLFRQETRGGDPARLHQARSEALDDLIHQRLLEDEAERRGVSVQAMIAEEAAKRGAVSDEEVRAFYDENQERIPDDFEAVAPRIRQHLERQAQGRAANAFLSGLREERDVEVLLETPRMEVAAEGPSRGPGDAPVTVIEFSDYQCPYCKRAEPVVAQMLERYPERVRFVYRHFPLDSIHPQARAAAHAAVCAESQDRFWEYHALLFEQEDLGAETLEELAQEVGLDLAAFEACLEAPETRQRVAADVAAGRAVGVSGTPAFFVNGVPLSGARPIEDFVDVIEKELEAPQG
jgi:protein-disulfide isomerase